MTTHPEALVQLFEGLYQVNGWLATYHRGDNNWADLRVVKAKRNSARFFGDETNAYQTSESDDFVVLAAEWRALTGLRYPERLDRIVWTDTLNEQRIYRVGVEDQEDVYRDPSALGVLFRIHSLRDPADP